MIRFECEKELEGAIPLPTKAIKQAPSFFKKIKPQSTPHAGMGTVKRCIPFLDALSSGFIIPLWADMAVTARDGEITIDFPQGYCGPKTIEMHNYEQAEGHPLSELPYGKFPFKFINPWLIKTPANVSCIFTSPLNHLETRFKLLDGVVDTDTYRNNVNLPFLWTAGDGDFFIERGTPLVQIIPFERADFEMEVGVIDEADRHKVRARLGTYIKEGYRKEYWHKRKEQEG